MDFSPGDGILGKTNLGGVLDEAVFTQSTPTEGAAPIVDGVVETVTDPNAAVAGVLDGILPDAPLLVNGPLLGDGQEQQTVGAPAPGEGDAAAVDAAADAADADAEATTDTTIPTEPVPDKQAEAEAPKEPAVLYISSFECDVSEILVTEADNYVTCTVAAESSEGVSSISAAFYNVPMTKRILMNFGEDDLVSGEITSGVWQVDLTIPQAADQGVWSLGFADMGAFYGVEITDKAGNVVDYAREAAENTIIPLQKTLTIESYKGNNVAYPQANIQTSTGVLLEGVTCDETTVTVTDAAKTLTCAALLIPDEAGLGKAFVYLVGPTGKTVLPLVFDGEVSEATLIEATNTTAAMYSIQTSVTVPVWAELGAYGLPAKGAYQPRTLSHANTIRLSNPNAFSVKPALKVVGVQDKAAPRISNFYCNQGQNILLNKFDAVAVNCLLRAADEASGISYASMHFTSPSRNDAVEFAFVPSSPGLGPFPVSSVKQVAENVQAQFPPQAEPGAWTLVRAVVTDNSGNYREYTATELDQANVQTFFLVQSPTKTFAITPKNPANAAPVATPGQTTSGAFRGASASLVMVATLSSVVVGAMSLLL